MVDRDRQALQLQTRDRSSWSGQHARPVLAGLMLIVVLAAVRAAGPAVTGTGPWHQDALQIAGAFEFVLAVLLIALWLIVRHRPEPGHPAALLRAGLLRAILLGMLAVAVLAGLSRLTPLLGRATHPGHLPRRRILPTPRVVKPVGAGHNFPNLTYIIYGLLALLLVAAIAACVVVILRRVPRRSANDLFELADDDDGSTRIAIESGRRALRSFDDAQAAIIACYVAMEASLAGAGTARHSAETPDELLARAVASGLLHGAAAGRLTALFYEARFSSHALPATARDEADRALDAISAELARREESGQVSSPSAEGVTP